MALKRWKVWYSSLFYTDKETEAQTIQGTCSKPYTPVRGRSDPKIWVIRKTARCLPLHHHSPLYFGATLALKASTGSQLNLDGWAKIQSIYAKKGISFSNGLATSAKSICFRTSKTQRNCRVDKHQAVAFPAVSCIKREHSTVPEAWVLAMLLRTDADSLPDGESLLIPSLIIPALWTPLRLGDAALLLLALKRNLLQLCVRVVRYFFGVDGFLIIISNQKSRTKPESGSSIDIPTNLSNSSGQNKPSLH